MRPIFFGLFALAAVTTFAVEAPAQFQQQGPMLSVSGGVMPLYEPQQYVVALSADGNTALIGVVADHGGVGAAWVFVRRGGAWVQQGKLVANDSVGKSRQGIAVALSADGNTALVGGFTDNTPGWGSGSGAAWVFTRSNGVWTQQGSKLVGTGGVGFSGQGYSVALSADGNTALVGGYADDLGVGAVWVFTRSKGMWSQQGHKLIGGGTAGKAHQGESVALSADGNTAIVGGDTDNGSVGATWVFTRSGAVWTQQGGKLVGTGTVGGSVLQGGSVALSADGNTAIVGGHSDGNFIGAVWVFARSGGAWTQQGHKLVGTGAIGQSYQGSVALSGDGNTAVVGGFGDDGGAGAAWVFVRSGGLWMQQGSKLLGAGAAGNARQGSSVALSADGKTLMVGGSGGFGDNGYLGAAWVFTRSGDAPYAGPAYSIVDIGDLGGSGGWVTGTAINNDGWITGYALGANGDWYGFLYRDGAIQSLGTLPGAAPMGPYVDPFASRGTGINNSGWVTGYSRVADGSVHAFLYKDGAMQDLGTLGPRNYSRAWGINDSGWVTGESMACDQQHCHPHAFLYKDGKMQDLGPFGSDPSKAENIGLRINSRGWILGQGTNGNNYHAFIYVDGTKYDLGTLGGHMSTGAAINGDGWIVGTSGTAAAPYALDHVYIFTPDMQDLGNLGSLPGWTSSLSAINNCRSMVGTTTDGSGQNSYAIEYGFPSRKLRNLNDLVDEASPLFGQVVLESAVAINDRGQIVVSGYYKSGTAASSSAPPRRTFLLTPLVTRLEQQTKLELPPICSDQEPQQ